MSATPEFVAEVATGYPAVPQPEYDQLVCVIGCSHSGTYEPRPWGSSEDIATEYTSGPTARDGRHLVSRSNLGLLIQRVESTTPGSYDTINNSSFTGTAVPTVVASVVPRDEGEGYIQIATGGTISVDGITYYASDDNGRLGATELFRLGTSTRITLSALNAAVEFEPPSAQVDVFIALAVEIRADLLAHFANNTAHNSADTASAALITLGAPGTAAAAWAVLNQCRTAWASHLADDTAHDSTDIYNTLTAPVASTTQGGIVVALELKADINSHLAATYPAAGASLLALTASSVAVQAYDASELIAAGVTQVNRYPSLITFTTSASGTPANAPATATITGTNLDTGLADTDIVSISQTAGVATAAKLFVLDDDFLITYSAGDGTGAQISIGTAAAAHNSADVTNVITATSPTTGTVEAGDIIRFPTFAPAWGNTQLATAIAALVASDHDPSMLLISGRILPANMATLSTGLNNIETDGGRCTVIAQARKRTASETEAQWRANLTTEWSDALDYRIALCAGDGLATFTDGGLVWQYARGFSTQAVRRLMAIPRHQTAWEYELGALQDFTTADVNGVLVGHDEKKSPGLKAAKFWTCYRERQGDGSRATMLNFDVTRWRSIDRVRSVRVNRITNRMILEIQAVGLGRLGKTYDVKRTSPTAGLLSQKAIDALIPLFAQPIKNGFRNDISDWSASDLIVIGSVLVIDPDTDAFDLVVTINYTPKLPVGRVSAKFAVRLGV